MARMQNVRDTYGQTLIELVEENKNCVVLDADLSMGTRSAMVKKAHPENFFEMGIAEQNMVAASVGLALTGKIPFVNTFANFLVGRAYDQIRVGVALSRANVKLIGSSAGFSNYPDGGTHQSVEDITLMRALPGMTVIVPSDAVETAKAVRCAAQYEGPVYIRLPRDEVPVVFPEDLDFEIGKVNVFRDGRDVTVFACGIMVSRALEAAGSLAGEGISLTVANISTIKPLDEQAVRNLAARTGKVITVEEHSIIGGLGGAICEALKNMSGVVVESIGVKDVFGQSACSYDELLRAFNLTAENIADSARKIMRGTH